MELIAPYTSTDTQIATTKQSGTETNMYYSGFIDFLNIIRRPVFHTSENTTFRKLDIFFLFSDKEETPTLLGPLAKA
jgi:hypothetical protein